MVLRLRNAYWVVSGFVILSLAGCVTTQERPDGKTVIRFSAAEALGMKPANAGANGNAPGPAQTTVAPPMAPMLATTTLAGLFVKHPYDGTPKTYFPRVALTIVDWSRNDCWVARAKIWWSAKKSEDVAPFSTCFDKQSFGFTVNSIADMQIFLQQLTVQHTGNVRTEGPTPPMMAAPDRPAVDAGRAQQSFDPFLKQIIAETGWKGGAPMNFWIVGYGTQAAAAPTVKASVPSLGAKQLRDLENALSCRPTGTLDASLKAAGMPGTGDPVTAPDGLTVFGLPVVKMAFNRESGEVSHLAYFARGVTLEKLTTAARLKADKKGGNLRKVQVEKNVSGFLAAFVLNGSTVLSCAIDSELDLD